MVGDPPLTKPPKARGSLWRDDFSAGGSGRPAEGEVTVQLQVVFGR